MRNLRLIDPMNMKNVADINIGVTTINSAYYIKSKECIAICSNDKHINFYDVKTHKSYRRFMVPEAQIMCDYS
jgi:hypothetical protein